MYELIKPGFFGSTVAADVRRVEFDIMNDQYLSTGRRADVLFFGDSITQYWELELYFAQDVLKINRGIGGDSTTYAARRFDADVMQLNPRALVMLLGINDLISVAPNLWYKRPGADPEAVIENIEKNYRSMLEKCTAGERDVYVCSVLPQSLCPPYDRALFASLINRTNEILKALCREYGATYVDYYSAIACDDAMPEELSTDGVHPNGKCYAIMADVLRGAIKIL